MPLQRSLYLLLGSSPIAVSRSPEEKSFGLKASGTVSSRGFVPTDRCLGGPHPSGGWLVQKSSLNDIMGKIVYVPRSVDCEKSETSEDPFCESDTLAELAHFGIGLVLSQSSRCPPLRLFLVPGAEPLLVGCSRSRLRPLQTRPQLPLGADSQLQEDSFLS